MREASLARILRAMPFSRIAALAVLLVHLFASVATGVVYLCQMSGEVGLSSCCCQHRAPDDFGDDFGHGDEIRGLGCCDATQLEANRAPTLAEKRASEPVAVTALPAAPDLRLRPGSALVLPRIDPAPPDGPPIYLRTRSLLL
jgi:hypothetical protein